MRRAGMLALALALSVTAQARAQSVLDGFAPNANGAITAVVVQPDGKILIGGGFTQVAPNGGPVVTRNHIARLNPDGTLDTAFNPDANGVVNAIALQADGKILAGGYFNEANGANTIGGQTRNHIARLDATTGAADSFNPNPDDAVLAIALQTDGKILAGGLFTSIDGLPRNYIARFDATSGLPDSFDPDANNGVLAITVQTDGKILAGGSFAGANSIGGQPRNRIARLNATTGLADSFNPNANNIVDQIAVQADGKIIAGGLFSSIGGQTRNRIARLQVTTGLADSFDPNADGDIYAIAVQADGKILAGGYFANIGGQPRNYIARLDPTTGLADSFITTVTAGVISLAVQADGKVLAGSGSIDVARLETDGRRDQTLDIDLEGTVGRYVLASAMQPDGKIVIGGQFTSVLGVPRNNIARLNTDGTLDTAFDPDANNSVVSIAAQADGKILVGGSFTVVGGRPRDGLGRLDPNGVSDLWNPAADGLINTIVVQADGRILVGGFFNHIGGQTRSCIARLDSTTAAADSFNPNAENIVRSIAVQADGQILAGGHFGSIGDQLRNFIARLDSTTGLADSWNPTASQAVLAIAVQPDGKILAGGGFATIGGETRSRIARLDPLTGLADSFDPNADAEVDSIVVQADGKVLASGGFSNIGGQPRGGLARLEATNGLADSFDPSVDSSVYSITLQPDGKVLAGFLSPVIGAQQRDGFARLSNDTAALQNLAVTRTAITWTRGGSSPQLARATFESSTDNLNYTFLGHGTAAGSNWTLTGLSLPIRQNIYIRARGHYHGGYYSGSESITESVRNAFLVPSTFANISTRLRVQSGDNVMIGGFIITGTQPKTVVVRGLGPSLPVPGALADPVIEVHGPSGELLGSNDNWNDALTRQQIIDSGLAPVDDLESALWGTINPGAYTVVVRGRNDTTGVGLFEVYDLDQTVDSRLANVSTRGFVETGDNVMVGGIIIIGTAPARVLFRAIGPSLANLGLPNALPDPTLELHDGNGGLIASNDNWRTDQEAEIIATTIPPSNDLESAIVRDLAPGSYTAIVRGADNSTGVALVEAYAIN